MHKIDYKPLTVNQAWQGKRFKTKEYKAYEKALLIILPKRIDIPDGKLRLELEFGVSSKLSDWDNPIKPFQDILQKKYGFNDNRVYEANVKKVDVKKGEEFISFNFEKA